MIKRYRAIRYPPDESERSRRWLLLFLLVILGALLAILLAFSVFAPPCQGPPYCY
jgi:O-antigen/teichoic acid export membrane protein